MDTAGRRESAGGVSGNAGTAGGASGNAGGASGKAGENGGAGSPGHDGGTSDDGGTADGPVGAAPPRLIAPLSTATVTSRRPMLRWALAAGTDGALVEICRDRACTNLVTAFDAHGSAGAPATNLPSGVLFWRGHGRSAGAAGLQTSPVWQFTVGRRTAAVNASWGTTLDVNGDGYADVLVGDDQTKGSNNVMEAGRAYVFMGSASGLATSPAVTLVGPDIAYSYFASAVADAGDLNGDGYADVAVGTYEYQGVGAVYIYYGGPNGLSSTPGRIVLGNVTSGEFGDSIASAGDLNGDGYANLLVGAYSQGNAYVYFGGADGVGANVSQTLVGPDTHSAFGKPIASAGDLNGDGYADVVVGEPSYGVAGTGRAFVYMGGPGGVGTSPAATLDAPNATDGIGGGLAGPMDVNGDGYADLLVGAGGTNQAYVYLGRAGGLATSPTPDEIIVDTTGMSFGSVVSAVGDVDGDGYDDAIFGSYAQTSAFLYRGGASGLAATPVSPALTGASAALFGESVLGAGDVNGDGYPDVVVGGWNVILLYAGGASGLPATASTTIHGGSTSADFGLYLARLLPAGHRPALTAPRPSRRHPAASASLLSTSPPCGSACQTKAGESQDRGHRSVSRHVPLRPIAKTPLFSRVGTSRYGCSHCLFSFPS